MLRWVALILLALLIALQVKLWSDAGGMREVDALRAAVKKQADENQRLQQRNQALAADVSDLKGGEQAVRRHGKTPPLRVVAPHAIWPSGAVPMPFACPAMQGLH